MTAVPRIWLVLLAALLTTHCAGSLVFAVRRSVDQALDCDCDSDRRQEEISAKVKDLPAKQRQFHRYYRAWCCGREVFLECQARVREQPGEEAAPSRQAGPAGDVSWSCWVVEDPTREKGESETRKLALTIDPVGRLCRAQCARESRCQTARFGDQDCLCACRHRFQKPFSRVTPEFALAASACLQDLECKRSDDSCFARGRQAALDKNPDRILRQKRCMEVRRTCRFPDDLCRALVGLQQESASRAVACLAGECSAMEECLQDAIGQKDPSTNPRCQAP